MESIEILNVPNWIENSDFIKQFRIDYPDENLVIPQEKEYLIYEYPNQIQTIEECVKILETMRYFGIDEFKNIDTIILDLYLFLKYNEYKYNIVEEYNIFKILYRNIINYNDYDTDYLKNGFLLELILMDKQGIQIQNNRCSSAAKYGHVDILRYYHVNGEQIIDNDCKVSAENGNLDCLKYCHNNGCKMEDDICLYAARKGHLNCLIYAHENGCKFTKHISSNISYRGKLECLKYVHEHGGSWNEITPKLAAEKGHLNCLIYAYEHQCPWDKETCTAAAKGGHFECLVYAHERGCPWDEETSYGAYDGCAISTMGGPTGYYDNSHLKCLKYLIENNCPGSEQYNLN